MLERLLIAGSGGQGVLLIGRIYAQAAVDSTPHVTYYPAYGAEVRGGTSNCEVILSSDEIASPLAETHDSILILNEASQERFRDRRGPNTLVVLNVSLCRREPGAVAMDATRTAMELGDVRAANFAMLGAYVGAKPLLPADHLEAGIRAAFAGRSPAAIERNIRAFRIGMEQGARGRTGA